MNIRNYHLCTNRQQIWAVDHGVPDLSKVLLVGIDLYQCDGSRKREEGEPVSLKNPHECVNDVQANKDIIRSRLQRDDSWVLTSSAYSDISKEPQDRWPTFDNINKYFDKIKEEARAGDQVIFHSKCKRYRNIISYFCFSGLIGTAFKFLLLSIYSYNVFNNGNYGF